MKSSHNIGLLKWHEFFTNFSLWEPLAIIYFSKVAGSYTLGLSVFSVAMLSASAWELPTGIFSDFYGRKMTLIAGAVAYTVSVLAYATAAGFGGLLIGAVLEGLGRAFYSGNNDALVYDNLADEGKEIEYEEHQGRIGAMGQWAAAISAILTSLTAIISLNLVIWLSIIPQIICVFLGLGLLEMRRVSKIEENIFSHLSEALGLFVKNAKLRWLTIANTVGYGISESGYQFRSAFIALLWPVWAIGLTRFLSSVGAALSFRYAGKTIKKFKALNILLFDSIYSRVINFVALIFPTWLSPLLMTTTSLLFGVTSVAENALLQREFSEQKRATMGSLTSLAGKLLFAIFAVLLGMGADKFGPGKALLIANTAMIGVTAIYYGLFRRSSQQNPRLPAAYISAPDRL